MSNPSRDLEQSLQYELDAAKCEITQLKNKVRRQDYYYDQLYQHSQNNECYLRGVAAEQSQRQREFDDQKAQWATERMETEIIKQSLQHEFKCHQNTECSLSYERQRNANMLAVLHQRHLPHPSSIANDSEIEAIRRGATQMRERLRSNASVIKCLEHTVERFQKEKEEMGQKLLALKEGLAKCHGN